MMFPIPMTQQTPFALSLPFDKPARIDVRRAFGKAR